MPLFICTLIALHAHHEGRHPLRSHHRGSSGVRAAVEDFDAALPEARAERTGPRISLRRIRGRIPLRRRPEEAAREALGRRHDRHRHHAEDASPPGWRTMSFTEAGR